MPNIGVGGFGGEGELYFWHALPSECYHHKFARSRVPWADQSFERYTRRYPELIKLLERDPASRKRAFTIDATATVQNAGGDFWTPILLFEVEPQAKIIFRTRNPTDRVISDWPYSGIKGDPHELIPEWISSFLGCLEAGGLEYDCFEAGNFNIVVKGKRLLYPTPCLLSSDGLIWNKDLMLDSLWYFSPSASPLFSLWKNITENQLMAPMAIGLYILMIEHWLKIFPSNQFLVSPLEAGTDASVREAVRFLNLTHYEPHSLEKVANRQSTEKKSSFSNETRVMLDWFFRPYNERLLAWMKEENPLASKDDIAAIESYQGSVVVRA